MPFLDRHKRLERVFKRIILLGTLAVILAVVVFSAPLRLQVASAWDRLRIEANRRIIGLPPTRAQLDALIDRQRAQTVRTTFNSVKNYYETLKTNYPRLRHLFDVMQLDPDHLLMVSGRPDNAFIVSPGTFELDHKGRIYRLKPNTHSLWVYRITYLGGPFGMFLVPDTPEVRQAAHEAEAAIDEPSLQTTNSWGVRAPSRTSTPTSAASSWATPSCKACSTETRTPRPSTSNAPSASIPPARSPSSTPASSATPLASTTSPSGSTAPGSTRTSSS